MFGFIMADGNLGTTSTGTIGISLTIPEKPPVQKADGTPIEDERNEPVKYTLKDGTVVFVLEPK